MEKQPSLFEDMEPNTPEEPTMIVPERRTHMPFLPGLKAEEIEPSFQSYEELEKTMLQCSRCALRSGCTQVVAGQGPKPSAIMFIGEGPGQDEDIQGIPFVGRAGQLLNKILAASEIPREEVFITNVVKCRPPQNRLPLPDEVRACRGYLEQQIRMVHPNIIVCLGSLATQTLIDSKARITKVRGQWYVRDGIRMMATFHPAALLRNPNYKRPTWEDFKLIRDAYKDLLQRSEERN